MLFEIQTKFLNELELMKHSLDSNSTENDPSQNQASLQKHINALLDLINRLYHLENFSVEEKSGVQEEFLPRLSEVLNLCNKENESFKIHYYNLLMIRTSIISGLMQSWGEQGRLNTIGAANVLAQILIGLEIEPVEELLPDISSPQFEDIYRLAFNYINILGGCYYIAACKLHTIDMESFIEWCLKALEANQRIILLIEKYWQVDQIKKRNNFSEINGTANIFKNGYYTHQNVYTHMIRYLLIIDSRFQGKWPDVFNRIKFLNFRSRDSLLKSIWALNDKITQLQTKTQNFLDLQELDELSFTKTVQMRIDISHLVQISNLALEKYYIHVHETKSIQEIPKFQEVAQKFFSFLEKHHHDMNTAIFLKSNSAEYWAERFPYIISSIGILTLLKNNSPVLSQTETELKVFFDSANYLQYPLFTGFFSLIKTMWVLKTQSFNEIPAIEDRFIEISTHLPYHPRDSFSYYLLGHLLKFAGKRESKIEIQVSLKSKLNLIKKSISSPTREKIEAYFTDLFTHFSDRERKSPISIKPHPTDPNSLFIPDFTEYLKFSNNPLNVYYLPFNLNTENIESNTN